MNGFYLTTAGLILNMVGVIFVFIWGPPQPDFTEGIKRVIGGNTVIDPETGVTAGDYALKIRTLKIIHTRNSRIGLSLIGLGFLIQLIGLWV